MKKQKPTGQKDRLVTEEYLDRKLEGFATKDDLKGFATKDDLEDGLKTVIEDISKLLNDKIDRIATSQDIMMKKFEIWEQGNSVGANQIRRHQLKLANHEKRIAALEATNN